ncbi:hypothetical protein KSP40_PGU003328 [Platanthera guangdongensis]|uniref:Uncharacterized protein n=1 Tax=Platanthera guangdongensis TaxID=2320717 RepID=A0ABR2M3R3_9ASPA
MESRFEEPLSELFSVSPSLPAFSSLKIAFLFLPHPASLPDPAALLLLPSNGDIATAEIDGNSSRSAATALSYPLFRCGGESKKLRYPTQRKSYKTRRLLPRFPPSLGFLMSRGSGRFNKVMQQKFDVYSKIFVARYGSRKMVGGGDGSSEEYCGAETTAAPGRVCSGRKKESYLNLFRIKKDCGTGPQIATVEADGYKRQAAGSGLKALFFLFSIYGL